MSDVAPGGSGFNATVLARLSTLVARAPALGGEAGWRFRYRGGWIDLVLAPSTVDGPGAERARRLAATSAAAAIVNLRLVIGHLGYEPHIEIEYAGEPAGLIARVGPGRTRPPVPDDERLYAALRRLPEDGSEPPAVRGSGQDPERDDDSPDGYEHELGHVIDAGLRECAGDLEIVQPYGAAATAIDAAMLDPAPAFVGLGTTGTGISTASGADTGWSLSSGRGAYGLLVIATQRDDLAAWLATGRALQAMRLEAACRDLTTRSGVPDDHGAYNRAALGRIVVPEGPPSIVQIALQVEPNVVF
jgi:hypothetical protein